MSNLICSKCREEKNISCFYKDNSKKSGLRPSCKTCIHEENLKYRRTKHGLISNIFQHQKRNSKKRKNVPPTYSQEELREWAFSQKIFHELYDNWKRLDFQKDYTPSIDRKNDYIGYTMSNIQMMTWANNKLKSHADVKSGKNNKYNKPVVKINLKTGEEEEFHSMMEASRITGATVQAISKVCNGAKSHKTAGGYGWKLK